MDAALAGLGIGYVLDDRAKEHFKPGRWCACSRIGAHSFRASICTTPDGGNSRRPSGRSSTALCGEFDVS